MNWDGSAVDPRMNSASLHNSYFAALPLDTLHAYRRVARTTHVANVSMGTKQHQISLVNWPDHGGWPKRFTASRPRGGTGYTYG